MEEPNNNKNLEETAAKNFKNTTMNESIKICC